MTSDRKVEIAQELGTTGNWVTDFNLAIERIAELERDAARYRWLKENGQSNDKKNSMAVIHLNSLKSLMVFRFWVSSEKLDEIIDTAMVLK